MIAVLIVVGAIFWINTGFLAVASAQRALDSGEKLPIETKLTAYLLLAIGVPADFVYNATVGTVRFREAPKWFSEREFMYTGRVARLCHSGSAWRRAKAIRWARVMNAIWPGHIKNVPDQ